jgi:hypothetical protein
MFWVVLISVIVGIVGFVGYVLGGDIEDGFGGFTAFYLLAFILSGATWVFLSSIFYEAQIITTTESLRPPAEQEFIVGTGMVNGSNAYTFWVEQDDDTIALVSYSASECELRKDAETANSANVEKVGEDSPNYNMLFGWVNFNSSSSKKCILHVPRDARLEIYNIQTGR